MSWILEAIYDRAMRQSEEACLAAWRRALLTDLRGTVLEIGAGTGANLGHYPDAVDELVLCEPDRHMRRTLRRRVNDRWPGARVSPAAAEEQPVADGTCDAVVST